MPPARQGVEIREQVATCSWWCVFGGVFAIKVSGCVPERFFFARRFCPPQVVKRGAVLLMAKKQTATTEAAAAFHSHSRTNRVRLIYGRGEWT